MAALQPYIFINDVFIIWKGTIEELNAFHQYLNRSHNTMKFDEPQYNAEESSCNFLDMKITISEGKITTDLYKKPTDVPSALLPSSAHPGHISNSIVFSMAFRLLRIVSSPELFNQRLGELKENVLIPRGYKPAKIEAAFAKVRSISRVDALKKTDKSDRKKKNSDRIIVPLDYNPRIPPTGPILQKNYTAMIRQNPALKQCFKKGPMVAHRQPPNLRKALCRAKLYPAVTTRPTRTTRSTPGWRPCGAGNKGQCPSAPTPFLPPLRLLACRQATAIPSLTLLTVKTVI